MTSRGLRKELRWRWASAETRELNPPDDSADVVVKVYVPGQKKGLILISVKLLVIFVGAVFIVTNASDLCESESFWFLCLFGCV